MVLVEFKNRNGLTIHFLGVSDAVDEADFEETFMTKSDGAKICRNMQHVCSPRKRLLLSFK